MLYEKPLSLEDRKLLPLNGPSNYRVENGKVITRAIEVNAVRQCNLSCKGCSHSSPISSKKKYELESLRTDLITLSRYMQSEFVRIVGGEPLLHPNFSQFLQIIKESNIAEKSCLVTNGLLLNRIDEDSLDFLDKIEISLYPMNEELQKIIRERAQSISRRGIKVRILDYSEFRESIVRNKSDDSELIQTVYETCQIAHNWRCITVDNNRIYRCPQSMINAEKTLDYSDSIMISEIEDYNTLLNFFENNNYLTACRSCLGSIGKKFTHQQVPRELWESHLPSTLEVGIDLEYAKKLSRVLSYKSDCMTRNNLN